MLAMWEYWVDLNLRFAAYLAIHPMSGSVKGFVSTQRQDADCRVGRGIYKASTVQKWLRYWKEVRDLLDHDQLVDDVEQFKVRIRNRRKAAAIQFRSTSCFQ